MNIHKMIVLQFFEVNFPQHKTTSIWSQSFKNKQKITVLKFIGVNFLQHKTSTLQIWRLNDKQKNDCVTIPWIKFPPTQDASLQRQSLTKKMYALQFFGVNFLQHKTLLYRDKALQKNVCVTILWSKFPPTQDRIFTKSKP